MSLRAEGGIRRAIANGEVAWLCRTAMSQAPTATPSLPSTALGWITFLWGVGGVGLILLNPIFRLGALPIQTVQEGLTGTQWAVAIGWIGFMLYSEGWRGFHKQFAPRVAVRALGIARAPRPHLVLLAPFVCMGLLHATRKRKIVAWSLLTGIVILVVLVRQLPAPWRGIIDMGVVLGLIAGLASVLWFAARAASGNPPDVPSDLPGA